MAISASAEQALTVEPILQPPDGQVLLNHRDYDPKSGQISFGEAAEVDGPPRSGIRITNASGTEQKVQLAWTVTTLTGEELHKGDEEAHTVPPGEPKAFFHTADAGEHIGPFLFRYRVTANGKTHDGVVPVGQANAEFLLEDYEKALYPATGEARLDANAAHHGRFGVRVETPAQVHDQLRAIDAFIKAAEQAADPKCAEALDGLRWWNLHSHFARVLSDTKRKPEDRFAQAKQDAAHHRENWLGQQSTWVPLARKPSGKLISLSLWVRAAQPGARLELTVDAVIDNYRPSHRWVLSSPPVDWPEWRPLTFALPIYNSTHQPARPEVLKKDPKATGPANYPIRVESLAMRGVGAVEVDDLTFRTQDPRATLLQVIAGSDKPGNLVFPGEPVKVTVRNGSLRRPTRLKLSYGVHGPAGQAVPERTQPVALAPGASTTLEVPTQGLPVGVYDLHLAASDDRGRVFPPKTAEESPEVHRTRFVVYRPDLPQSDTLSLSDFLRDAHRVEIELGKDHEIIPFQWHNSYPEKRDGIEPREGVWMWHEYDELVRKARSAGKEIVGRLGLTSAWASPVGRYDDMTGNMDWVGSPFIFPSRTSYWKRYVYKVVRRYREQVSVWQVWDKPDDPVFNATANEFIRKILKVAHDAARSADPNCKLLLGGITKSNLIPFLRDFVRYKGPQYVDAIGLAPTVDPLSPERAFLGEMLQEAQRVADKGGAGGKLWLTACGWNVGDGEAGTELGQAQYLSRALVLARFAGIERILLDLHTVRWEEKTSGVLFKSQQEPDFIQYRLAAFAYKHFQQTLGKARPLTEIHLRDSRYHLSRAYLFEKPEGYVLAAWRENGTAQMPRLSDKVNDMVGNALKPTGPQVELSPSPITIDLPREDIDLLRRRLERLPLTFEDAPESEWKKRVYYFVDVGDPAEEKQSGYSFFGKGVTVSKSSQYGSGRALRDAGRTIHGSETYTVPLKGIGDCDLILSRRIDYSEATSEKRGQRCQVSVDGQPVGVWSVPGRDRRRHWRDTHFLVPNRLLANKASVKINLLAADGPFTTFEFAAGPKKPGTLYLSDIQPLADTQGWIGSVRPDTNFLHSPLSVLETQHKKGLGVHAPSILVYGLSGQFRELRFQPGLDDVTEGKGSVRFKVYVDGRQAYDSRRADAFTKLEPQAIDVTGAELLRLVVEDGADGKENDIANWCGARLTY